jgi:hypothetical protein
LKENKKKILSIYMLIILSIILKIYIIKKMNVNYIDDVERYPALIAINDMISKLLVRS